MLENFHVPNAILFFSGKFSEFLYSDCPEDVILKTAIRIDHMHRHILTAHGSIAYLQFRTKKSKRYPYKCSDCNFYKPNENTCNQNTCQKNQEMAKGTRFDKSLTEKQKSALLDFNNFEVWSGSDSEDKAKEKSPEKPSSSKATDGQPIGAPDESTEKSTEAGSAKPSVKSGVFRQSEKTDESHCQAFNEDEMQLVPLLDSSTDENTVAADTTAVIKAEQGEQDLEVTGKCTYPATGKSNEPIVEVNCPKCGDKFNKISRLYRHIRTHYGDTAYLKARTTPHACMKWECGYCGFYYRHEKFHQSKACNDNRKLAKEGCPNVFHDGTRLKIKSRF